ncbi:MULTISPECIES: SRPBCC family protein [unclassified Nocardia]|uniref:SRPBCC family protein n=1 Tax=unclassified Nocardia TaxID=2637762 RepID=UPI001CE3C664|nr:MULTISPECIES: SRPBCC family protein [unclassified Nocardia]
MYVIAEESVITGEIAQIWQAATDVENWPSWDPHEQAARIDGPFEPGTKGWVKPKGAPAGPFTLVAVEPKRSWTSEAAIPFGKIRGHYTYDPLGDGTVRVAKRMEVHGPFVPVFRLIWERGIRTDMRLTMAALEKEARRLTIAKEDADRG